MLITSLKQTSPEHVTVCLEDGGEIRTTLGVVTELRLFSGRDLDHDALNRLQSQSGRALAREKALQLISQRQMSRRELGKKLKEKGFDPETADYCVDWVTERGLLNEDREELLAAMPEDTAKIDRFIAQRLTDPDDRDAVRKLTAALFRRGFGMEEIRRALERFQTSLEDA